MLLLLQHLLLKLLLLLILLLLLKHVILRHLLENRVDCSTATHKVRVIGVDVGKLNLNEVVDHVSAWHSAFLE